MSSLSRQPFVAGIPVLVMVLTLAARPAGAACVGDCDGDGEVLINEIVAAVNIFLGTKDVSSCPNADQNGDGQVLINEIVGAVNSFLDASTCPMVTPGGPTPTPTLSPSSGTPTPSPSIGTPTLPSPSGTPTLPPPTDTSTPTLTPTVNLVVCGDGVTQSSGGAAGEPGFEPEECDDGGICVGGDNAGTACTSESDCIGDGVCTEGPKIGQACANDDACPGGQCIHCKPFGGDGCAANCTFESDIPYDLVAGINRTCDAGSNEGNACTGPDDCPGGACTDVTLCLGGENDGAPCAITQTQDCPGGQCLQQFKPGTSGAFIHDGYIQIALPLEGSAVLTIGKLRNGTVPGVIKADSVQMDQIAVAALACVCVRAVPAKTCGGTVFNADGTISTDCSDDFTAGASVCAGTKPCAFVHGPGNSSSGLIGCNGLEGIDLSVTQDVHLSPLPYPPPPTPPLGAGQPVIALTGTGGPGSAIVLNTAAIGTAVGSCTSPGVTAEAISGPDLTFCTDDDPQSSRGMPQPLLQVTGEATGLVLNTNQSTQPAPEDKQIGPFGYTGAPYDCTNLTASPPTAEGANVVGAFTALNQPNGIADVVVRDTFVIGPRR